MSNLLKKTHKKLSRKGKVFSSKLLKRKASSLRPSRSQQKKRRITTAVVASTSLVAVFTLVIAYPMDDARYQLSPEVQGLVGEPTKSLTPSLILDLESNSYQYNQGYRPGGEVTGQSSRPKFSASFALEPEQGVVVDDVVHDISVAFKPKFDLAEPRQDQNRIIYPLESHDGVKVVSLKSAGFKEDIIINNYQGETLDFSYDMVLPEGTSANLEQDGSLAIYGADPALLGDVVAESEEDQELLRQARTNADKTTLLFTIPAPFVKEHGKAVSDIETEFSLEGNELTVHAYGLDEATYPLSIDPSIYVESASQFMRGNNETNIDFDVDNGLIRKGPTTGASFDQWSSTLPLNNGRWSAGTVATGGNIYSVGGNDGTVAVSSIYWARLNTENYTVDSPNAGDGACSGWCSNSAYDLPEPREGLSVVAYNGYLYAIGGLDDSGLRSDHVYIAKLGANGEPRLWHPTNENEDTWVYWYRDENTNLSSERSYHAAATYENRIYILGGQTDSDETGITTVEYADIEPDGTFGSWTTTGMSNLPPGAGRHKHTVEVYNDRIYIIGGVEGSMITNNITENVFYAKLENGAMTDWRETSSLSSPRMAWGGNFTAIWGGYVYQSGGCTEVNEEDIGEGIEEGEYCTELAETTQFSSINADGSLEPWHTVSDGNIQRMGHNLVSWNGALYHLGGCSGQDIEGDCTGMHSDTNYTPINSAGDISELSLSSASGIGTCDGGEPYDCNLPPTGSGSGQGGQLLAASTIVNGFLYVIGGCTDTGCNNASGNVSYVQIETDGSLSMPETCDGSYYGSWCVDSSNQVNGNQGVAAAGLATFGDTIYIVGGLDGNSNTNAIFRNTINNDGSLDGSWTSQSLSGAGASSLSHVFAYARADSGSASTTPGNLYIFGGCSDTSGAECVGGSYENTVYKCDIQTDGSIADCATTGQLQIDTASGATGSGLAMHGGAVFADYIYLVGGATPGQDSLDTVRYARIDSNNDIVAVSGGSWIESASVLNNESAAGHSFAHNGYLYSVGGYDGSATGEQVEFARINPSDGSLDMFSVSNTSIDSRWGHSLAVSDSRAYILGGCGSGTGVGSCGGIDDTVRTVNVHNNASGSPANYSASGSLFNTDRIAAGSAINDGYIYIVGGCTDSASCIDVTDDVQYAPLDGLGNIGSWSAATSNLPEGRAWGRLEAVGGTLYYIGGQDESLSISADIYYATPSSGDVSSWSVASNGLPEARAQHSTAVWDDRIYVTGGESGGGSVQNSVYVSPQLSSGGDISSSWISSTAFEGERRGHTATAYAGNIYIMGGYDGDNYLNDVQYVQIEAGGSVGSWSTTSSLPISLQQGDGFAANGYIYLFGGRSSFEDEGCLGSTFVAPIASNTSESEGSEPTGLGSWFESASHFDGERFGISATYHEGKSYLLGGGCAELLNLSEIFSNPGLHTFTPPEETVQVVVEAWGGGGGGGEGEAGSGNAAGAGGGGGGYSRHTMPVSPGNYDVFVGAGGSAGIDGDGSWFDSDTTAFADGGGGASWGPSFGAGGSANIGSDATFSGGDGGTGHDAAQPPQRFGGGGGGSAFFDAAGGDGQDGDRGSGGGAGTGTGDGGAGNSGGGAGGSGSTPGGGGGGGGYEGPGGSGATGRVIVYYDEWSELVLTGENRVTVGTLLSQPQVASYSLMIDADTNIFPYGWMMNGLNSSELFGWEFQYRSSTAEASTWGQETNFVPVTFGQPQSYTPLDESGTDTDFARYYHFKVSVDSSKSYGYPDAVARGPTVNDISLYFTADPAKRFRHGKTFLEGSLQPLETPF